MPNLRLCRETDIIEDPPAPLPISRAIFRRCGEETPKEDAMDSIDFAQQALANTESKMAQLNELMDEEIESYNFKRMTTPDDDDGPYAA